MFEKLHLDEMVHFLRKRIRDKVDAAVILGSGLHGLRDRLEREAELPYGEIPGFPRATVQGHPGILTSGALGGRRVLVFSGRFHLYQNLDPAQVILPVLLARHLGAEFLLVTCSVGGVNETYDVGDLMLIEDHINLMGFNPLWLIPEEERDPPFLGMVDAYDPAILEENTRIAASLGLRGHRGVLAGIRGPSYETRAEVRYLRRIGADAVGMSTIPEVIMARHLRMRVGGVALVTNKACDLGGRGPTHDEVLEAAHTRTAELTVFLERVLASGA